MLNNSKKHHRMPLDKVSYEGPSWEDAQPTYSPGLLCTVTINESSSRHCEDSGQPLIKVQVEPSSQSLRIRTIPQVHSLK